MIVKNLQYAPYEEIFLIEKQKLEKLLLPLLEESRAHENDPDLSNIRLIEKYLGVEAIRNIIEKHVRPAPKNDEYGVPCGDEWSDLDLSFQAEGYRRITKIVNAMAV